MIAYVKKHSIKNVIFDITDRMTRNITDRVKIDTLINEHDVNIHFARTNKIYNKNSKPDEGFMFDIEVAVAKKLSADISLKTRMGNQEKVEQGGYSGSAPVGYINNVVNKTIEPDPVKAPLVKRTFELYSTGNYSLSLINDQMYSEGLRGKRLGSKLSKSKMFNLLRNPLYCGVIKWKGKLYKGAHKPIISKELFDSVQNLFTKKPRVDARHNFAYGGLIVCGDCGCKLTPGIYKKKYPLYHCTFSKGKHANAPYLNDVKLTAMFEKTIDKIALTKYEFDTLKEALKEDGEGSAEAVENRLNALTVERRGLEARISRLYDEKLDKKVSEAFWSAKHEEYSAVLSGIEKQIDELKRDSVYYYDEGLSVLEPLKELKSLYESSDSFEKAELLKIVSLNHTLIQEKLLPDYKKPYIYIAELRECSEWGK